MIYDEITKTYPTALPEEEPARQYAFMDLLKAELTERKKSESREFTMHVETFGCQMNAKDSEKLAGILSYIGYVHTDSEDADIVVYNTCTVRENANTRVYGRIGYLGRLKKSRPGMRIVLCGCMMQEEHVIEKIRKSYPFIDVIFGTHNIYMLAELLYRRASSDKCVIDVRKEADRIVEDLPSLQKYGFKAGVNIMYGCNNFCTYCIVPYVRGRERSRNPADIVRETEMLVENGVREVMLLGQNVNSYGKNLEPRVTFAELIREVSKVEGLQRIRFMTPHPKDLSDELIEEIAVNPKICKHVHLPLQSGSSRLLKLMNRHYTKESFLALTEKIRKRIPDVAITTDIIIGFPGETEEDFEDTLDVVRKARFMSAFTFIYSKRSGTPAAEMDGQVPEEVCSDRMKRLLATVGEVAAAEAERYTGKTETVLCEEYKEDTNCVTGRLDNNLLVHFPGGKELLGEMVSVTLSECKGFYYLGHISSDL
ncbi:MAG: tRNA (N6-isopentenyl adenosine(37)-C2)-methylthiotransferase MiaB [Lachnospiraceae bacterium]|nr:tRNA (N6-isopentenyl adenosine(37)-C2)-methylthiotransferase MiaB [Lachnospiraceae bacterium]